MEWVSTTPHRPHLVELIAFALYPPLLVLYIVSSLMHSCASCHECLLWPCGI